jgi:hypothetical protein
MATTISYEGYASVLFLEESMTTQGNLFEVESKFWCNYFIWFLYSLTT